MISGMTLEEVLTKGRGVERPFRCHVHDDTTASASVNVIKGVWFCYACRASGGVGDVKAPSVSDLLAMTEPEKAGRVYPESYLELFERDDGYWHTRFPAWLVWHERLGVDPFTGHATFPVRTPQGRLAGVGRRNDDPEAKPRYRYPPRWSASRALHGYNQRYVGREVVLVEGAADRIALAEVGIPALACYGAGLHLPQLELLRRLNPSVVLCGFDEDEAGERATALTMEMVGEPRPVNLRWPGKDPAATPAEDRVDIVRAALKTVVGAVYAVGATGRWTDNVLKMQAIYEREAL